LGAARGWGQQRVLGVNTGWVGAGGSRAARQKLPSPLERWQRASRYRCCGGPAPAGHRPNRHGAPRRRRAQRACRPDAHPPGSVEESAGKHERQHASQPLAGGQGGRIPHLGPAGPTRAQAWSGHVARGGGRRREGDGSLALGSVQLAWRSSGSDEAHALRPPFPEACRYVPQAYTSGGLNRTTQEARATRQLLGRGEAAPLPTLHPRS
jgi:hypothetical protein